MLYDSLTPTGTRRAGNTNILPGATRLSLRLPELTIVGQSLKRGAIIRGKKDHNGQFTKIQYMNINVVYDMNTT